MINTTNHLLIPRNQQSPLLLLPLELFLQPKQQIQLLVTSLQTKIWQHAPVTRQVVLVYQLRAASRTLVKEDSPIKVAKFPSMHSAMTTQDQLNALASSQNLKKENFLSVPMSLTPLLLPPLCLNIWASVLEKLRKIF